LSQPAGRARHGCAAGGSGGGRGAEGTRARAGLLAAIPSGSLSSRHWPITGWLSQAAAGDAGNLRLTACHATSGWRRTSDRVRNRCAMSPHGCCRT